MGGGSMQLVSVGQQDQFLYISPEMSYFKQVYKRHTPFAMQSVRVEFDTGFYIDNSRRSFSLTVKRTGDLLKDATLCMTIPPIYSSDTYRFRWIENMPKYLLYEYYLTLGQQEIDHRWGEWMDVWNELSMTSDQQNAFDTLSGNVPDFINPTSNKPRVTIKNNRLSYSTYPVSTGPNDPSIPSRNIYIPLDFWFSKNPSLALPLVALQYQPIVITISLRPIEQLYQVWDRCTSTYVSSAQYNTLNNEHISISTFSKYGGSGPSTINVTAYIECNYIFLDNPERTYIAGHSVDYLIERVTRDDSHTGITNVATPTLTLNNPVKELVWMFRRSDAKNYNAWANYAAESVHPKLSPLSTVQMWWNGQSRFDPKQSEYFNLLQPSQFHTSVPRQGIFVYSFALYPEKLQPSGSFNASIITRIQLQLTMNPNFMHTEYDLILYSIQYNVFRVIAGSGAMMFAM